jgi:hypothetical protein
MGLVILHLAGAEIARYKEPGFCARLESLPGLPISK